MEDEVGQFPQILFKLVIMIELANRQNCTGCKACLNACYHDALSFVNDEEGFSYPHIDVAKCVECGMCQASCPELHLDKIEKHESPTCYAAYSYEHQKEGSSGGMFSALADYILEKGGYVFGASFDDRFVLRHIGTNNKEDVTKMRGSKYLQSDILYTYREVKKLLIKKELVLFTGTPCQIEGLMFFLRHKSYDNLVAVDIICHGVPSQGAFSKLIRNLGALHGPTTKFSFRKLSGWSIQCRFASQNGTEWGLKYDMDAYMQAFYKNYLFREGCYRCKYATKGRCSDITLADFWGIGSHGIPFKKSLAHGISLVLENSTKGKSILVNLLSSKKIYLEERPLSEGVAGQHNLKEPSPRPKERDTSAVDFVQSPTMLAYAKKYNLLPRHKHLYLLIKGVKDKLVDYGLFDISKGFYNQIKNRLK